MEGAFLLGTPLDGCRAGLAVVAGLAGGLQVVAEGAFLLGFMFEGEVGLAEDGGVALGEAGP